jgi:hypothetical protein
MKTEESKLNAQSEQLDIPVVSGSYEIGDKIVVFGELFTTIHYFDGDIVWFYDHYAQKLRYCNINQIQHDDGTF